MTTSNQLPITRVRELIGTLRSVTLAALQLCPTFPECYRAARVSERTTSCIFHSLVKERFPLASDLMESKP